MKAKFLSAVFGVAMAATGFSASAATLDDVKAKGFVQCGVSQGLPGFSQPNSDGSWTGIDVDVCRGVAAAIFGDDTKVKYTPLSAKERFTALSSGEVDILSRNTTWTATRDTQLGLNFAGVNYYDGQGFLVRKDLGVSSALELSGASICTNTGTTTELNVTDYFTANKMDYELVAFEKADEVVAAYDSKRCDVYTTDASGLYAQRLKLTDPGAHVVLKDLGEASAAAMLDGLELFGLGYSWGGFESLAVLSQLKKIRTATHWSEGATIRLSIGLEHPDDLIEDLRAGLDRAKATGS